MDGMRVTCNYNREDCGNNNFTWHTVGCYSNTQTFIQYKANRRVFEQDEPLTITSKNTPEPNCNSTQQESKYKICLC